MPRRLLLTAAFAALAGLLPAARSVADDKKEAKATVDLTGSLDDLALMKEAPPSGVVVSEKGWEKLAKAWGIMEPPKLDFSKELLAVATTRGGQLSLNPKLDEKGDLRTGAVATRDLRNGFRYAIKSVSRDGVKTVNGRELPKE